MTQRDDREIQLADLNALLALLRDGTVTRAAQSLGLTQSTLSHQLDRMRARFGDRLFVRVGNRMAPTPFAQRLAEPAARVLRIVETEIAGPQTFDAASSEREFRVGVNELGAITLVPRLMRHLKAAAPKAQLTPVRVDTETMAAALESGALDVVAGHFPQAPGSLLQQVLYHRDYVCVARRDHPRIGASMNVDQFRSAPQVHTPAAPTINAWMDARLRRRGRAVGERMLSQHVAAIPFIVAAGDHVAVIPRELYELFLPIASIKEVKLPIAIPSISIHQYWHPRLTDDPAIKFFRELVRAAAQA